MKKGKWLAFLSLLVLLAMIFSSCAQPTEEPTEEMVEPTEEEVVAPTEEPKVEPTEEPVAEPVELTILSNMGPDSPKGPIFDAIVADFMAEHPNIVVKHNAVPDADEQMVADTAFAAGKEDDLIFHNYPHGTKEWVEDGFTIPLNDYFKEWGLDALFHDGPVQDYINTNGHGELAALPMEGFNWPIWYNTAILDEAGVDIPTTMDELLDAAAKIRAAGYQPLVTGGSDWTGGRLFQLMLMSHLTTDEIVQVFEEGGFSENPKTVAAVELFAQLRDAGVFADNSEGLEMSSMNAMFFSGEAAMMHAGSWSYGECPEDLMDDVVLAGLPLPEGSPYAMPTYWADFGAKAVHVTRNGANNIDAVREFVTYLYQPEVFAPFVNQAGTVPPIKDVPLEEDLNLLFANSMGLPDIASVVILVDKVTPPALSDTWLQVASDAFIPGTTADDILAAIDALYEGLE